MAKHCDVCNNDFDGRKTNCPYCEDDVAYQRDRIRRQSNLEVEDILEETPVQRTPIVQPTGGAAAAPVSTARVRLDESLNQLGDVSDVVAEFRSLSMSLNKRMDKMEQLILNISDLLPVARNGTIQDGGAGASGTGGTTSTGGASGNTGAAATGSSATEGAIRFNFGGSASAEHRLPSMIPPGVSGGQPLLAGNAATPAHIQDGGGVGGNGGAAPDNGAEPDNLDGANQQAPLSKFDLRRFLPASERKKALVIDSNAKLFYLLSRMLDDLGRKGYDVMGLVSHISYLTWMASTNIYTTEALAAYDYAMRERAREGGVAAFTGGDTNLTNMYLGASGTKQFKWSQNAGSSRYGGANNSNNNNNRPTYGNRPTNHVGWRAAASRRGICFSHAQGQACSADCRYRHECSCGATDHAMLSCPTRRRDQGGDRGGDRNSNA